MAEPSHPMLCGACVGIIFLNENEINDARRNFRYHCFGRSKLFQMTIVRSTKRDKRHFMRDDVILQPLGCIRRILTNVVYGDQSSSWFTSLLLTIGSRS